MKTFWNFNFLNLELGIKSSGIVGGTTDPYALGGNSSVSAEVKIASIIINPINDIQQQKIKQ